MVLEPKSLSLTSAKERIYVRTLTLKDLDACVSIENQAFIPEERCSRKHFKYRLATCPELSLGIFTTTPFPSPFTGQPTEILLGHAIASKTNSRLITDTSMGISPHSHVDSGSTIALHSLAILPSYQRRTLGTMLLTEFIRRARGERIAIIARERLVRFYERFGFVYCGVSAVAFGGGGWRDLVLEFEEQEEVKYVGGCGGSWGWREGMRSNPMVSDHGM